MKNLMFVYLYLFLIQHAQCFNFQENNQANPLKNLGMAAPSHPALRCQLEKRQSMEETNVLSREEQSFCHYQVDSAACSTGVRVGFIEAALSCGRNGPGGIEEAQRNANECAMNEGGNLCASALTEFELVGAGIRSVESSCSEVLAYNFCPLSCRTLLEDFSGNLGCCINAYINGSMSFTSYSGVTLNYNVWKMCNVSLPATDCANAPTITPPENVKNCTEEEYYDRLYTLNACLPQRGPAYIAALMKNFSTCSPITLPEIQNAMTVCSLDANGVLCGYAVSQYPEFNPKPYIDGISSACSTLNNQSCTPNCRDSIMEAKRDRGCCLNTLFYNSSKSPPPVLSYSIWSSCGIETPGVCNSLLNPRPDGTDDSLTTTASATSIMVEKTCFIIFITTSLLCFMLKNI